MRKSKGNKDKQTKKKISTLNKRIRIIEAQITEKYKKMSELRGRIEKLKLESL